NRLEGTCWERGGESQAAGADDHIPPASATERQYVDTQLGMGRLRSGAARGRDYGRRQFGQLGRRAGLPDRTVGQRQGIPLAGRAALATVARSTAADACAGGPGHYRADGDDGRGLVARARGPRPGIWHHRRGGHRDHRRSASAAVAAAAARWPPPSGLSHRQSRRGRLRWRPGAPNPSRGHAVNRALLMTGLALIDVCWLYPWSLLVAIWIGGEVLLSPLSMLVLLLTGAFLTLAALAPRRARN